MVRSVVVVGGSIAGSFTALTLARAGHAVTLLERDDLAAGERPGAPHVFQSHSFIARCVHALRSAAPDVLQESLDVGASLIRGADHLPPWISDRGSGAADDDCVTLACRRPVFDALLARTVASEPGVTVVRAAARGLLTEAGDPPRVLGVVTDAGPVLGDVVVDASGRRSLVARWVQEAGGRVDEGAQAPCGNIYLTRFYAAHDGATVPGMMRGFGEAIDLGFMIAVAFRGDAGTWSISLQLEDDDVPMRRAKETAAFDAVIAKTSLARLADPAIGSPTTPVHVMAGLVNRLRRLVVEGRPGVLGLVQVGDSVCITNPTFGRGMAFSLGMALRLRECLAAHDDDGDLALAYDATHDVDVLPWFRNALVQDVATRGRWRAELYGEPAVVPDPHAVDWRDLFRAALRDRTAFDAMSQAANLLITPEDALRRSGAALAAVRADNWMPPFPPAPSRAELLSAVGG